MTKLIALVRAERDAEVKALKVRIKELKCIITGCQAMGEKE